MAKIEFAEVYVASKDFVWRLTSKYIFSKEDREDLFQEIFVNVHKALSRFRGESSINTWVYRIAVNTSINYLKKQKRHKWIKNMISSLKIIEEEVQIVEIDLQEFKPLKKLNPQQRMVLILSDVEEKKLDEIAEIMKIPVGTVKSNLHRAREIVKKEVSENGRA